MSKTEVIGLGALNMDNIYLVEGILVDGETLVKETASYPGGSAANTICGLAKLGVSTGFIGAVGNDTAGKALLKDFEKAGVDTSRVKVKPGARSGSTLCLSDGLGRRSIYILPGANSRFNNNDIDIDYVNQAGILHISSFVDESQFNVIIKSVNKLKSSVKISFSPGALYASKRLDILKPVLSRTHILFINHREIRQLTGDDVKPGMEICLEQGCRIIVVTLGKSANQDFAGAISYIRSAENEYIVKPAPLDTGVLDTTGAGDAFAAGFLYGFLKNKALEECGLIGDTVARFSIAKMGARPGLPTFEELARRYRQLYNEEL